MSIPAVLERIHARNARRAAIAQEGDLVLRTLLEERERAEELCDIPTIQLLRYPEHENRAAWQAQREVFALLLPKLDALIAERRAMVVRVV